MTALFPATDHPPLPRLLPYGSTDGDVVRLRDGSLGVGWEYSAPSCETSSVEHLQQISDRMETLFRLLPEGTVVQFLLAADRDVREPLRTWEEATALGGLHRDLARSRIATLEGLHFTHEGIPVLTRRVRRHLTIRVRPSWPRLRLREAFRTSRREERLAEAYDEHRRALLDRAGAVENLLVPSGFGLKRLTADALLEILFRTLNPSRCRDLPPPRGDDDRPISDRVCFSPFDADLEEGLVRLGGVGHRLLSVIELPRETWPGMLERGGKAAVPVLDLIPEGRLVFNVEVLSQESARRLLASKKRFAFCQLSSGDARADVGAMKEEVDAVLREMFVEGSLVLSARIHIVVRASDGDEARRQSGAAANALSRVGLGVVEEDALAPTLFLQTLPFAYDPANDRALRRGRRLLSPALAHLLPVYGSYAGTSSPDLLLLNRRGEPVTFSPFDAGIAPHCVVAGVSGSGKSVLANHLILSALRRGDAVFVLDRGDSYRKLCRLLGGDHFVLDPSNPRPLTPFGRVLDEERAIFLVDIVSEMCTQGTRELSVRERSLLTRALARAFDGREVLLSDIRDSLRDDGDREAADLALCLDPFCGGGPFAGFFDRPREEKPETPLTVIELGDMAKRKEAAGALLLTLLHNIGLFCARQPQRRKYLLIDEAWTLLQSETTARFLEDVLRTYRKRNASAVMITQQVADFEGRAGAAIRANAPNRIFLRQTPETVLAMEKLLDLTPEEKELLSGLVTVKGKFSEMLVLSPSGCGAARLIQDPLAYWLTTSDPAENAALDRRISELSERGCRSPLEDALRSLAITGAGEMRP